MSPASLLLSNQLCFALYSTSLAMSQVYKLPLRELGLTYPQYIVMLVLWERDASSVSEIGARLFLDSGTLTPLLKRLERSGLVKRERDDDDERRVIVRLTAAGKRLQNVAVKVPVSVAAAAACSADEALKLRKLLETLRANLHESTTDPTSAPRKTTKRKTQP